MKWIEISTGCRHVEEPLRLSERRSVNRESEVAGMGRSENGVSRRKAWSDGRSTALSGIIT